MHKQGLNWLFLRSFGCAWHYPKPHGRLSYFTLNILKLYHEHLSSMYLKQELIKGYYKFVPWIQPCLLGSTNSNFLEKADKISSVSMKKFLEKKLVTK